MKQIIVTAFVCVVLLVLGGAWLYGQHLPRSVSSQPTATTTPTLGTPTAVPTLITVNTSTTVTVTVSIPDSYLIPNSVNVLRLGAAGTQPAILGVMHDDGVAGDTVAGDHIYTLQVPFNETVIGQFQLQVSAAFKGLLKRIQSAITIIQVGLGVTLDTTQVTITFPPGWLVQPVATTISASSPLLQDLAHSQDAEVPPEDLLVRTFSKDSSDTLATFGSAFDNGWLTTYAHLEAITVDGHAAILYSDSGSTIQHQPPLVTIVDDPVHDQVVVITLLQLTSDSVEGMFRDILSTIRFNH